MVQCDFQRRERFAFELAKKGFTVVSGMARGVDTHAHRGALKARGRTIAVIGSGFRHMYPSENEKLAGEIAQSGAVVSEFPMDTEPLPFNFPRRNRIISGLSMGVLVAEAARNSGALITADFALDQGREVFALPGKIDAANAFGANELIKQGAKLVSGVEDIVEELAVPLRAQMSKPAMPLPQTNITLDESENVLYNLLSCDALQLDEIVEKAHLSVPQASQILLGLQFKKAVRQLPGKHFVRG